MVTLEQLICIHEIGDMNKNFFFFFQNWRQEIWLEKKDENGWNFNEDIIRKAWAICDLHGSVATT